MTKLEQALEEFRNTNIIYKALNKEYKDPVASRWQSICQRSMDFAFMAGFNIGRNTYEKEDLSASRAQRN